MAVILVVEDNQSNMEFVTFLLESAGHSVLGATNAEAGLTLARERLPALILMDIQLPGMDGLQATMQLKQHEATSAIPVIALTALAMKGDEQRILAAGCDGYIAKPPCATRTSLRPSQLGWRNREHVEAASRRAS